MPDFDKDLNPFLLNKDKSLPTLPNPSTDTPNNYAPLSGGAYGDLAGRGLDPIFGKSVKGSGLLPTVSAQELYGNRRYDVYSSDIVDIENQKANAQSRAMQAVSGVLKGTNLAATTVAGGFGMLYGAVKSPFTGRLADIWDNEVMQGLDKWNNEVDQNYLPNYYSNQEKNAEWYHTDNWMTTNFLFDKLIKNAGFAVGAMVSGNIANGVLGAAGAAAGRGAMALAGASEASQAFKIFTPLLRNTARAFSAAKNIEVAGILEKEISSIAELSTNASKIGEIAKQTTKQFAGFNDSARRTAIAAYSSAGEASFEALQTSNEHRNKLIEEYKSNFGTEPEGEALASINKEAEKVGKTSFLGNLALLTLTEFKQLPYLAGSSYSASKRVANSLAGKVDDVVLKEGKYVSAVVEPTTKFGKLYKSAKRVGGYVFDPKEAGQEIGQYALQVGTQNYYNKAKETNNADILTDGFLYGMFGEDEEGEGVGALVSKEGIEGGILGGITGGLMQARRTYKEAKAIKSNTEKFINSLNNTPSFQEAFKERLAAANRGIVLQQQQQDAVIQGDKLEAKDLDFDMMHNYMAPRIKYGRADMINDDLNELKQMGLSKEGLASLTEQGLANINDTVETFQTRLNTLQKFAENTEALYNSTNLRFSGEILRNDKGEPILNSDGKQVRKYSPLVIDKMVYAASKIANYDLRIPQVNAPLAELALSTADVLDSIIKDNKPNREATDEVLNQINKLDTVDANKDSLKSSLSEVIELSLRRKAFIQEYNDIQKNPLNYETSSEYAPGEAEDLPVSVAQLTAQKDRRRKPAATEKQLQIGREYSLEQPLLKKGTELYLAPKLTVLSQTLGGEYEVRLPNGKVEFLTPSEFKEYKISDENNTSEEMEDILDKAIDTVLNKEEYLKYNLELKIAGEKNVYNKKAFINDLDDQALIDDIEKEFDKGTKDLLEKRKQEKILQEKLAKAKEVLDAQQAKLEATSGIAPVQPSERGEIVGSTDKRKDVSRLFVAGTSPSEDTGGEAVNNLPHVVRARTFLNNFKFFLNRNKIKLILVTPNNAEKLGLEGIVQMSYNKQLTDTLSEDEVNVETGFMAQVFIVQTPEGNFFVNEKGEKLSKVGDKNPTILNNVVFETMTSAELKTVGGAEKVRAGQEAEAEIALEAYKIFRKRVFAQKEYTPYSFAISRGIPSQNKIDGKLEDNHIKDILGPNADKIISGHNELLQVVTKGKIEHNGELLIFPAGTVLVQYGDLLDYANNKNVNNKQANNIFAVIDAISKDVLNKVKSGQPVKLNWAYSNFLQNVLYWRSKGDTSSESQIGIDTNSMRFNIGKKSFPLDKIGENKQEILNALKEAFITVNHKTLSNGVAKKFTEFVVNKEGNLVPIEWANYQTYLLADKYPDGSNRSAEDTPLITHTAKPVGNKNSYKQKYAYITDKNVLPYSEVLAKKVEAPKPPKPAESATKIGEYEMDGTTVNTFQVASGPVLFTGTVSSEGDITIDIKDNATIEILSTDQAKLNQIDAFLTAGMSKEQKDVYNKLLNEEKAKSFLSSAIRQALEKQLEEQKTAPKEEVSDIEAKKADIEKRRQGEDDRNKYPGIKELLSVYNGGALFFNIDASGLEVAESLNANNVTADDIFNIRNTIGGKIGDWFERGFKELTGKTYEQYDAELDALKGKGEEKSIPSALSNINSFETAKGSVYTVLPDGRTQRFKTATGEQYEPNDLIVFVKFKNVQQEQDFLSAQNRQDGKKLYVVDSAGNVYDTNEQVKGKYVKLVIVKDGKVIETVETSLEPKIGYNTFDQRRYEEKGEKYRSTHLGNKVTKINTRYAALEGKKEEAPKEAPKDKPYDSSKRKNRDENEYREIGKDNLDRMSNTDLEIFKQWHADNVPFIPFEILENIIRRGNIEAWGVFENGVAKFVRGGLRGTEYHEIFEAIYADFLTESEKNSLLEEFKNKKGEFTDRQSGKKILYSEATDKQAKERIADDFSDFRLGKLPARSLGEAVRNLFKKIMDFFKAFVTKPSLKNELFKAIDSGKFKETKLIPRIKANVILPIGTSGSGKSTFIKSLPQENLLVIEPDAMRVEFTGNMNDKSKDKEIYIEAANRAVQAIKQGRQVVFDTTNLTKDKRLPFIEAIKKEIPNASIQYKLMELNPELAKQRIKAQIARGENRANVSDETIDRHAESYKQMLEDIKNEPIIEYKEYKESPEYRAIEGLTEAQTNGYIQDMVFQVKRIIFRDNQKELLFNPEKLTGEQVFSKVREEYENLNEIDALGEERYNELVKKSIEFLRTIGISFNADEVVSINDENSNQKEYSPDPFSVDWKKHSTGALKFLLSTLSERKASNQVNVETGTPLVISPAKFSDQGFKLLNFNRVFATLLDRLHNTNDPVEFTKKFIQLAKEDANYLSLFTALGGNLETHTFDFHNFGVDTDWRLFIQFFNTFSRQKPDALIQYISEEGDVYTGPANIYTVVKQTSDSWINNMKVLGKSGKGFISYGKNAENQNVYKIDTAAIKKVSIKKSNDMLAFLSSIGIEFPVGTYDALSDKQTIIKGKQTSEVKLFTDAVNSIHTYLGKNNELMTFDGKRLDINGPLRVLAGLYTKVNNPNQDSTYFGVEGQRIGAFSENNAPSYFENTFNESETLDELLEKMPQLKDVYSKGSQVLKKGGLFFNELGERIAQIKVGYIQGSKNELSGKDLATSKLSLGERAVQEINQNINGNYYILIPGDSSTEWMMNLGNVVPMEDIINDKHWKQVYDIYNGYLNDDINLALENRTHNTYTAAKSQELRIMKDILPKDIVKDIEDMIKEEETSYADIQDYIIKNKEDINNSIKEFIEGTSKETFNLLINSNQISAVDGDLYLLNKFDTQFLKDYRLSGKVALKDVMNLINFANINYAINNQEYHKILIGDPYQFKTDKGKLDETKRIKSFLSGRRRTFDHPEYNNKLKEVYNTVDGIELTEGIPGHHKYKEYTNTITLDDVNVVGSVAMAANMPQNLKDAFVKTNETDAMSWLMDNTHKEIALKEGQWSVQAEDFHQWHMAYTRQAFLNKNLFKTEELKKTYKNSPLNKKDADLILTSIPKHKLAIRKPIISGNKFNKTEIDLVLDKTSQMPLYYHMVEGTSLESMYLKMFDQEVGYGIVISGRKVGSEGVNPIYAGNGSFSEEKFTNIVQVPWKIYGTQVETMSEGEKTQTRGSQLTKGSTSDLYENGEAIGATPERQQVIKDAVKRNTEILDLLNENAYNELLNKLGVTDLGDGYALEDKQRVSETLMYEMMRRELSENAKDTIALDKNGEFLMPFEASPSYVQIKSILYSMVNKALISPAMNGAPHVQVPVTMFEKATEGRSLAKKTNTGWTKITKKQYEALTEEEKKSVMLTDDTLKFYENEDGKRYCEIMLPHWFKNKFGKKTDEEILQYLNTTEGKKILSGIGFRIPTQALSSVEVFKVKGFLPQYMGYTVVVPSEITTKAGSDFDIDKLNIYLKSVYTDANGNVRLVKWQGSEQATKDFFTKVYEKTILQEIQKIQNSDQFREDLFDFLDNSKPITTAIAIKHQDFYDRNEALVNEIISQADQAELTPANYIRKQIEDLVEKERKLDAKLLNDVLKTKFINDMYKKSLENEYYDSLEELLTLPENFNRLISPIDDAGLEDLSELLDEKRGYSESGVQGRLINRNFMTKMRHGFITGKRWVGIAAVNITNLSLRQKSKVYLNPKKLATLSAQELAYVQDLNILLPHNTLEDKGNRFVSLSGTKTADGTQFISDRLSGYATAFVDIANKPFITKIIKSDVVVSTFMFLESIGAGNTGIFFLNQPIIEKYLEFLDSTGSKSVMGKRNLEYIKNQFPTTEQLLEETEISVEQLLDNIQEYGEKGEFTQKKNAEQQLILNEFIKYKILADQLFSYTQATNYDTTRFGSSDALMKKEWATFNASNFNLISNVDEVLKNTFIGKQAELLAKSFASFGAILKTELPEIKAYTISTLKKYATKKYMSMDDYEKIANLIKNSFIDYIIQNNTTMSDMIKPLLVDSETAVVTQLEQAKQKYPSIQLLKDLVPVPGNREGSAKSIQLKANVKDAYSENLYVGMMRELRDSNAELNDLYNNIVNVAILQGTTQSAISIRNIIPVEDYAAKIAPIIQQLKPSANLDTFANGMFERNNFANADLFTEFTPFANEPRPDEDGNYRETDYRLNPNTGEDELLYYIPALKKMKGSAQNLLVLSDLYNSFQLSSDYIKIPKVITARNGKKVNIGKRTEVTAKDYALMKQKGSQELYDAYYYKKVYTKDVNEFNELIPLTTTGVNAKTGDVFNNYYYKLVNVYGDGNRAVEFNTSFGPSVIDNGSMRLPRELADQDIVNAYASKIKEKAVSLPTETSVVSEEEEILNSPQDTEAILLKLGAKKVSKGQLNIDGQYWYLSKDYWSTLNKQNRNELFLYPTPEQEIYVGEDSSGNYKFTTDVEFYKKYGKETGSKPGKQLGLFGDIITLKDGKDYNKSGINSALLESLGYTPKEIGKILKQIC